MTKAKHIENLVRQADDIVKLDVAGLLLVKPTSDVAEAVIVNHNLATIANSPFSHEVQVARSVLSLRISGRYPRYLF